MVKALCNFPARNKVNKCPYTHIHIYSIGIGMHSRGELGKKNCGQGNNREEALRQIWKVEITCRNCCPLECKSMEIIHTEEKWSVSLDYRTNLLYEPQQSWKEEGEEHQIVKNQVYTFQRFTVQCLWSPSYVLCARTVYSAHLCTLCSCFLVFCILLCCVANSQTFHCLTYTSSISLSPTSCIRYTCHTHPCISLAFKPTSFQSFCFIFFAFFFALHRLHRWNV